MNILIIVAYGGSGYMVVKFFFEFFEFFLVYSVFLYKIIEY